jgi:glycosyltransferase involved in cell wall biosynthesis
VTGTVQDISAFLQKSTVAVAPIQYGAGIQNKVLEAMATGTPVVATQQGIAALSVQPERDLLVADQPAEFADKVLYLLDHPEERQRLGQAGREFVEANYRWDHIATQLEDIYQEARDGSDGVFRSA